MSFASVEFIAFFCVVLLLSVILQHYDKENIKQVLLLVASYFFYGCWDWRFCFLLIFVSLTAYFTAQRTENKVLCSIGIAVPLIVLGIFKYFNFFVSSISNIFGKNSQALKIILPVGISFYTFQALSYVIDVKRKKLKAERSFIRVALYISFFPQLVAGPIVRASDFLPQVEEKRKITFDGLEYGVQLIVFGLFKKIVLADNLSVFVDDVYFSPVAYHWTSLILAAIAYSLQIYFDFSGYSDIAIGCAKCFGYDFLPNFNLPYISRNITEFWRRWHLSLSTWLKEYLYIPLGGNRKGKARMYANLLITMLLGGLWHGADWTFVAWGGMHGIALCIDKLRSHKHDDVFIVKYIGTIITYLFVVFAWIFFRAENFSNAWQIIAGILSMQQGIVQNFSWVYISIVILSVASVLAVHKAKLDREDFVRGYYPTVNLNTVKGLSLFLIFLGLTVGLAYTGGSPFVYFQF